MSRIRPVEPADAPGWLRMRCALLAGVDPGELASEVKVFFDAPGGAGVLVMERPEGGLLGFIEISIRRYAEGCTSDNVGYIEEWYVDPDARGNGYGGALVAAAEEWARARGCTEMASDTAIGNDASIQAHKALGYREVERLVAFRKELNQVK